MTTVEWSDLPKEIWPFIGKFLHSRIDVLRFRSTCSLWRSSRPLLNQPSPPPPPPLVLPLSTSPYASKRLRNAVLFKRTLYRMESLTNDDHNASSSWLVKVQEDPNSGELRLLDPVTNSTLGNDYVFNLLDLRVVELRKSYVVRARINDITASLLRVVVMPNSDDHLDSDGVSAVFMVFKKGSLGFVRVGDEKLTYVDEQNSDYHDVIIYKGGQCYVVNNWGIISWVNLALEVVQFSPPISGSGGQKHLVESCGDLYVVVQYFAVVTCQGNRRVWYPHQEDEDAEAIDFKVYKLDQEWGKWVDVKDLGDRVFVLSSGGSFSVSTKEFAGVKGNCIFFTDRVVRAGLTARCHSCVFSLEDGRIRNLAASQYSQMVRPPSTLLSRDRKCVCTHALN